ncbi:hypothetical protein HRbin39_01796 [bacterium HR39]|nr:hypothetical protein HRbin39_01796 [bacterium HR39]
MREFGRSLKVGRRRVAERPLVHLVPNVFTVLGLCAGMTGMRYAFDARWELAVALVGLACVFDGLDGRSARLLRIESRLGAQLDSLADFMSFGVAPAVIAYLWSLREVRGVGWALAMLFATCCALRLARFNVELDDPQRPRWMLWFFKGIPAPAAAGLCLLPLVAWLATGAAFFRSWPLVAAMTLFVAVMMVSRVPTFSIKRLRIPPDYVVPALVAAVMVAVFLVTEPWATLMVIGLAYLASLPVGVVVARRMRLAEELERRVAAAGEAARPPAAGAADAAPPSFPTTTGPTDGSHAPPSAPQGGGRVVRLERRSE